MDAAPVKAGKIKKSGPWVKGQSGNPNGRPPRKLPDGRTVAEIARGYTDLAIRTLVDIATNSESDPARVSAANGLLDRGWGKPTQPLSGDEDRPPLTFTQWPLPQHGLEAGK
jgi:hypothetical protein